MSPMCVFFRKEISDQFKPDQMQFPAPDLIVEVLSPSTMERDPGIKFKDYALHGVQEYWIVDPESQTIEQYRNIESAFNLEVKSKNGSIHCLTINGLDLLGSACFNEEENLAMLRTILN